MKLHDALQSASIAARSLFIKSPGFSAVAVLILALGIGANTAVFSVLNAVVLRPLSVPGANRLVNLAWEGEDYLQANVSALKLNHWREFTHSFDAMATWQRTTVGLTEATQVRPVDALYVNGDLLGVLGYVPLRGRAFGATEFEFDGPRVALISHSLWTTRFAGTEDLSRLSIRVDEGLHSVVGVLPEAFQFPYEEGQVDVVMPFGINPDPQNVAEDWPVIARLSAGVSLEEAEAEVASLFPAFHSSYPGQVYDGDRGMRVASYQELYVREGSRPIWMLLAATAFVLLIACANIANLFLARAEKRRPEIAIRTALGATRRQIVALVLLESALVAAVAAAVGLALATGLTRVLVDLAPTALPGMESVRLDVRVLLFTLAATSGTAVALGALTALPTLGPSANGLRVARHRPPGASGRAGLLVTQSALSTVLLIGSGLLVTTLLGLSRVDPGFDADRLVAVRFPVTPEAYQSSLDLWQFQTQVLESADALPSVDAMAGVSSAPFERGINTPISVVGSESPSTVEWRAITPGYFSALDAELLAGRRIAASDVPGGAPIAVVNSAFARRFFPGGNSVGQLVTIGLSRPGAPEPSVVRIVGVVSDLNEVSLRTAARSTIYVPQSQAPDYLAMLRGTMPVFLVRLSPGRARDTGALAGLDRLLQAIDPTLPNVQLVAVAETLAASLSRERFGAALLSVLAALALALTAMGVYAVQAYAVRTRRREIGIRIALGAERRDVSRLVVRQGVTPVVVGVGVGTVGAVALVRLMSNYLWGVEPTDPTTYALAGGALVFVATVASWMPARDASRLHPIETLQSD